MKNVTTETNFSEIKDTAKELGINFVGKKKEVLVEEINAAIAARAAAPEKETKTLADYGLNEGEVVNVVGRSNSTGKSILTGRQAKIVKASKVDGFVKAQLINKNGQLQKTVIALPVESIVKQSNEEVVA